MTHTPTTGGTSPRDNLTHGQHSTYTQHKCRCIKCRAAAAAWDANRRRQQAYGTWQPRMDAIPVRSHVTRLTQAGMTWAQIAAAADINIGVVRRVLVGRTRGEPVRSVSRVNGVALLAVPVPDTAVVGARILVDATKARRQLQALAAAGWPLRAIARHTGISTRILQPLVHGRLTALTPATAGRIDDTYNALWDADPARHGIRRHDTQHARQLAAERRWWPPLAWDDDTIADPDAQPNVTGRCGEPGGYYDHSQLGTPACQPCRDAVAAAARKRKHKRRQRQAA